MARLDWWSRVSRRHALLRIGGGGLVVALVSEGPSRAAAQEDCPETSRSLDPPPILRAWADAWNAGPTAVAALYADNALYQDIPRGTDTTLTGTDVAGFLTPFVEATNDLLFGLRSGYRVGDRATAEWEISFRYTGQLPGLPPGTGQLVEYRGVTTFQLKGDEIQRSTDYYDFAVLLTATGALPAPPDTATPTA